MTERTSTLEKELRIFTPTGVVFGPVKSRRLGTSLGINVLPVDTKICSFDCPYCECGWTDVLTDKVKKRVKGMPSVDEVRFSLEEALQVCKEKGIDLNFITFAGNGEPTLHPDIDGIIEVVQEVKKKYYPEAKVGIFTNAANVHLPEIQNTLAKFDMAMLKLDVATDEKFQAINKPFKSVSLEQIIAGLKRLDGKIIIQSMFVAGMNDSEADLKLWIEKLKQIQPLEVQIYSLDRNPADPNLQSVPIEQLQEIAERVERETGIKARAYSR